MRGFICGIHAIIFPVACTQMKEKDFVTIATVQGDLTANVIKGRLECEGIPVFLQYETVGKVYGFIVDGLGQVKIMVPQKFAEQAKEILQENPDQTTPDPE